MILVLAVPFAVLFGGIFLLMYSHTSSAHAGAAQNTDHAGGWWGAFKRAILVTNPIAAGIGAALDWVFKNARGIVSHWALAAVKPVARWFHGLADLVERTYAQIDGNATDTAEALQKMRHSVIPHAAAVAALPAIHQAKVATTKAETALARERSLSETFTSTHRAQVKLNVHYTHAIDVTLPKQLGRINTQDELLSRDRARLKERTTSLENGAIKTWEWMRTHVNSLATEAFAGAVAIALTSLGFGFLRCRSWKGVGSRLTCGMGSLLLDLLNGVIDVLLIADLCQITRLMIDTAESSVVQDALGAIIGGVDDLLLCQNVSRPASWNAVEYAAPTGQAYSALPAVS